MSAVATPVMTPSPADAAAEPQDPRVGQPATPEELLSMPDSSTLELNDGIIEEKPVGMKSSAVGATVISVLKGATKAAGLDVVVAGADTGFECFEGRPKLVKKPDVSVVFRDRLPDREIPDGWVTVPADLAVEVVSPRDVAVKLMAKVELYLINGFKAVWVLYPEPRHVVVYTSDSIRGHLAGDEVDAGDVLPGVRVKVDDLFDV